MGARRGLAFVLLAVFLWSWLGIIGKVLYRLGTTPLEVIALRVLLAWAALLPFAFRHEWWRLLCRGALPKLLFYSVFSVVLNYLGFYFALQWISVTAAIVIVYAYPALVLVFSHRFLTEPFGKVEGAALVLTLVGIFLIAQGYRIDRFVVNVPGVGFAFLTSLSIAVYNVAGKRLVREFNPWALLFWGFTFGGLILWGVHLASGGDLPALPPMAWGLILCLALFPTLVSYGIYLVALRHMRAGHASLISTMEPLLAALWAALLLGERLEPLQILGGIIVLGVAFLILWPDLPSTTGRR
jgi:drug/metabolite transporter (DMT)-like permease